MQIIILIARLTFILLKINQNLNAKILKIKPDKIHI